MEVLADSTATWIAKSKGSMVSYPRPWRTGVVPADLKRRNGVEATRIMEEQRGTVRVGYPTVGIGSC